MKKSTDPIAQLMQEHNHAIGQLKLLDKAVRAFSQNGYSSKYFRQLTASLKFIENEVGIHNQREEEALFPTLERYVEGPTRILRNDHKKLKKGFGRLRSAIQDVNKRRDSFSAIMNLRQISKNVIQLFVNHIHKENYILFPLVQRFLSKEELREIARKML
ncbi:MAG TPA: hemerythrin domain-containing protein [Bacteroidota bacterium]|nr:hemerythrin domain-containing protein [Bacteroidota bacterium]